MKSPDEQRAIIEEVIDKHDIPLKFGLVNFPGDKFRVGIWISYVMNDGTVMLYLERYNQESKSWEAFAKGTIEELLGNIVPLEEEKRIERLRIIAERSHQNGERWLVEDRDMRALLDENARLAKRVLELEEQIKEYLPGEIGVMMDNLDNPEEE